MRRTGTLLLLGLLGAGGCTPISSASIEAVQHAPPIEEMALGPGDTIDVQVVGEADIPKEYRLGPDGSIDFPFIRQVHLEGLDAHAAAALIARKLVEKRFYRDPQVSIFIKDQSSKKIIVLGRVNKPGTFPYVPNMSILELITVAGGFHDLAWKNRTTITRIVDGKKFSIEVPVADIAEGKARNVLLRPGDIVSVPERLL